MIDSRLMSASVLPPCLSKPLATHEPTSMLVHAMCFFLVFVWDTGVLLPRARWAKFLDVEVQPRVHLLRNTKVERRAALPVSTV